MVHAAGAFDEARVQDEGWAIVHPVKGRERCGTQYLDKQTTFVHIDGVPNLWLIQQILDRAPNLRTIQVIPSMFQRMHPESHLRLCQERGVQVVTGHARPELAWHDSESRSPHYNTQRRFMTNLQGDQRRLFEELQVFGFEAVEIASRYFCLAGEPFIPQRTLAEMHGFSLVNNSYISLTVNAVLYYLDSSFTAGAASRRAAEAMRERVLKLRPVLEAVEYRQELAHKLGIPKLSASFPLARLEILEAILGAVRDGRMAALSSVHPNAHRALSLRFGLDDPAAGVYRTLQEVGDALGGLTRERARQLEEVALRHLGIADV